MHELSGIERWSLLRLARAAVERAVRGASDLDRLLQEIEITPRLDSCRAAFVSLKRIGPPAGSPQELRGCVGAMSPCGPLYRTVIDLAAQAALEDPRFPPLAPAELPAVQLEISVLTEPVPLTCVETLVVGLDGVELRSDGHHSVFLPSVAADQGWDARELLAQLARKAGLDRAGWRDAALTAFRTEVFAEDRATSADRK